MDKVGGILRMLGPIMSAVAPATGPAAPFVAAAGAGSSLAGGIQGAVQGQGKTPSLTPLRTASTSAAPLTAGGAPESSPGSLTPFVPSAGASTAQSYQTAMGNDVANNLLGPQNPFYQYVTA